VLEVPYRLACQEPFAARPISGAALIADAWKLTTRIKGSFEWEEMEAAQVREDEGEGGGR